MVVAKNVSEKMSEQDKKDLYLYELTTRKIPKIKRKIQALQEQLSLYQELKLNGYHAKKKEARIRYKKKKCENDMLYPLK